MRYCSPSAIAELLILNFGAPNISLEWVKLGTENFVCWLVLRYTSACMMDWFGSAIPGFRHFGRQPFGDGSVSPKGQRSEGSLVRKLLLRQCVGTISVQWVTLTWWTLAQRRCTRSPKSENSACPKFEGWERGRKEQGREGNEKEISVGARRHEEGEGGWRVG